MTGHSPTSPSSSRARLALEIAGFVGLALLLKQALAVVAWRYAGPLSLYILIALLTVYFRRNGLSWRDFGLVRLNALRAKLLIPPQVLFTLALFAAAAAPILLLAERYEIDFLTTPPSGVEERFGNVEGNLALYLLWLGIVWTAAAFGEEMFFRGYLVTRLTSLFEGAPLGALLAVALSALLFGSGHIYYQGLRGFIITGAIGVALGTAFLLMKRNLWPLVILHGAIDTATFTVTFLGIDPG